MPLLFQWMRPPPRVNLLGKRQVEGGQVGARRQGEARGEATFTQWLQPRLYKRAIIGPRWVIGGRLCMTHSKV